MKADEIGRKSFLSFSSFLVQGILGLIGWLFIGNLLFKDQIGTVKFALAYIGMFVFMSDFGFGTAHLKKASEEGRDLGRCIGTYAFFKTLFTVIMVVVVLASVFIWKHVLGQGFETPTHEYAIYIMVCYFMFQSLQGIPILTFQARTHVAKMQIAILSGVIVQTIAVLYVAWYTKSTLDYAATFVVGSGVTFVVAMAMLASYPMSWPRREDIKEYMVFAFPLIFAGAAWYMSTSIDKVILQFFGGAELVADYTSNNTWTALLLAGAGALTLVVMPYLSSLHSKNNIDQMARFNLESERYISMVCAPVAAFLIVMAYPFLRVMTYQFANTHVLLVILTAMTFIMALNHPWQGTIMGAGQPVQVFKINMVLMVLVVGLCALFVPPSILGFPCLGLWAEGAALATLIAFVVHAMLLRYYAKRIVGVAWNPRILFHILAAAAMGAVLYLGTWAVAVDRFYELIAFGLAGLGLYVMFLWLLTELRGSDIRLFLDVVHPRKMRDYVRGELKGKKGGQA